MVSRMNRLAPLARLAIVALVAQACAAPSLAETGAPSAGLPEASRSPFPTPAATAGPSVGPAQPGVKVTVEDVGQPDGAYFLLSGMWDEQGWIVVGEACQDGDLGSRETCNGEAAIWTSTDARAWERAKLAHGDTGWMSAVTHWRDAYYAASSSKCGTFHFWRSTDARAWEEVGSINGGTPSGDDGCPVVEHLAGAAGGLVATLSDLTDIPSRVIRSTDGTTWEAVERNAFGYPDDFFLYGADVIATDAGATVVARCGRGCQTGVWKMRDGDTWTRLGLIPLAGLNYSIVGGDRLVVGITACTPEDCHTVLVAEGQGGKFQTVAIAPDMGRPELAWTGDAYVLVGEGDSGEFDPPGQLWLSRDGLAWEKASIDLTTCPVPDLIGGPAVTLLLGDTRCGGSYLLTPSWT